MAKRTELSTKFTVTYRTEHQIHGRGEIIFIIEREIFHQNFSMAKLSIDG